MTTTLLYVRCPCGHTFGKSHAGQVCPACQEPYAPWDPRDEEHPDAEQLLAILMSLVESLISNELEHDEDGRLFNDVADALVAISQYTEEYN